MHKFGIFEVFKLLSTRKLIWGITDGIGIGRYPIPAYHPKTPKYLKSKVKSPAYYTEKQYTRGLYKVSLYSHPYGMGGNEILRYYILMPTYFYK